MIKRLLAILAIIPVLAVAAPNDIKIQQINPAGTAYVDRIFAPSAGTTFTTASGFRTAIGAGDVTGPASATDNGIARFDLTTGKIIQDSPVTIADTTGAMTWATSQNASLTAGSSGATLTLGQGTNGSFAANSVGTGALTFSQASSEKMRLSPTNGNLLIGGTTDLTGTTGGLFVTGNTGMGTTVPGGKLHVASTTFANTALLERSGQTLDNPFSGARILATKTTAMGNGFGSGISFLVKDNDAVDNELGYVAAVRTGADNTGSVVIASSSAGSNAERLRVTPTGNILIGTTTDMSGNAGLTIAGTTASTSSTTGAFIVGGGAGLGGNLALGGVMIESVTSQSGAGAVSITATSTKLTSTGSNALTLADGTNGQIKRITMIVDGGDATLTPTTKKGFSTIVFDAEADSITLQFYTTQGWMVVSNYNATVNP